MQNDMNKQQDPLSLDDSPVSPVEFSESSDTRAFLNMLPTVDRRSFLRTVGFSLASGALAGCAKPVEKILPHVDQPPENTPGVADWYATTCHGCTAGCGALAKVMDGRPLKLEGNPDHGLSKGGLCAVGQGSVVSLYDSCRQRAPASSGKETTWNAVDREISQHLRTARQQKKKIVVLTGTVISPSTRAVIQEFLAVNPGSRHVQYDAVSYDAIRQAHVKVYGQPIIPSYHFDKAKVVVSFGADFLGTWLSPVEFTKQYAAGRTLPVKIDSNAAGEGVMSRHFQFESRLSLTGSNADYRAQIAPSEHAACLKTLAVLTAKEMGVLTPLATLPVPQLGEEVRKVLQVAAVSLSRARGKSLVISDSNEVSAQMAVIALNELLENIGATVDTTRCSNQKQGRDAEMELLVQEMQSGQVGVLLIHDCNPAYTYPMADKLVPALQKVPCSVAFAVSPDETTKATTHHCPTHHPMESWGDAEPQAGRLSLYQPTIRPLYQTRAFEDSLLKWAGSASMNATFWTGPSATSYDFLRRRWRTKIFPRQKEAGNFDALWDLGLQRGFIEVPIPATKVPPNQGALVAALRQIGNPQSDLEVEVYESVALRDGSPANNPWLQELPDPLTKITWDNFAAVSPTLAKEKGIAEGQWIEVTANESTLKVPAHVQPGQHPRTISIALGYGRTNAGPVAEGVGANAWLLLALRKGLKQTACPLDNIQLTQSASGDRIYQFAQTQTHDSMEGRPIVREFLLRDLPGEELAGKKDHEESEGNVNLWAEHEYSEYKWGMTIDLAKCTGCSACVTGCDLENNVPVVGRDEVRRTRDMKWMRIDRYFTGTEEKPQVVHQPMLCQHCENASCESVCPALATVHDDQGLNVQVYNRCVGTRYCANNCPYKVRRFNFWNHARNDLPQNLSLNPDVTVRTRGVMEKCSFCIQRIQAARIASRREGRLVKDGEIRTACEQSCPAEAIVFGNAKDPKSRVSRQSTSQRGFRVLEELNRQPAVRYLAKVRNTNEEG